MAFLPVSAASAASAASLAAAAAASAAAAAAAGPPAAAVVHGQAFDVGPRYADFAYLGEGAMAAAEGQRERGGNAQWRGHNGQ